jgi:Bacterial SH3 domain
MSDQATRTVLGPSSNASPKVWESYEIVQPTRVFSAPSEHSQLIANVEPGTQVNVVDSRNGWLEIRSKHGRPPGFIQKTAAIRIGQN